jgi:hypothetical protein
MSTLKVDAASKNYSNAFLNPLTSDKDMFVSLIQLLARKVDENNKNTRSWENYTIELNGTPFVVEALVLPDIGEFWLLFKEADEDKADPQKFAFSSMGSFGNKQIGGTYLKNWRGKWISIAPNQQLNEVSDEIKLPFWDFLLELNDKIVSPDIHSHAKVELSDAITKKKKKAGKPIF